MINYNELLPQIVREMVADKGFSLTNLPLKKSLETGILFTDVTEFTKMTELVSKGGYYSIEIVIEILNTYFEEMYQAIMKYDGDLIKYGGDSIVAIFPGSKESAEFRMQACLLTMQERLSHLNKSLLIDYSLELDFHANMSWGEITMNIVGDSHHHLDYFMTGEAVQNLFQSEVCVLDYPIDKAEYTTLHKTIRVDNSKLRQFFSIPVQERLETIKFSGELKNSAVLFINVENSNSPSNEINIVTYNEFYKHLQDIVYFYEGTINKIDYTEKGYLILVTFGVPYIHNDDIERAFICSRKVAEFKHPEITTKIGLTYNNIYSGILGAKKRYEYGIIGNAVNISARLMSKTPPHDFTFSAEIVPHVKGRYETAKLDVVNVKGIAEKIEIHHVEKELSDLWSAYESLFINSKLLGYDEVIVELENHSLSLILGESGSGKSHLIYEFLKQREAKLEQNSLIVLSEYDKLKPFTLVYLIINKQLSIKNIVEDIATVERYAVQSGLKLDFSIVADYFKETSPEIKDKYYPLVCDIFTELLAHVLEQVELSVIENLQWLDSQSQNLLTKLVPKLQATAHKLIFTANSREAFTDFAYYSPHQIVMHEFDEKMIAEYFESEDLAITTRALQEILTLTNSNPAYIKEICHIIKAHRNEKKGLFDSADFQNLILQGILPKTFESALLNDFEALDNDTKQLLKYASIMGISFDKNLVKIFPQEFVESHIRTVLEKLTQNKHIFKKMIIPDIEYYFNNSLMRDAIYRTILLKEKQKLHLTIADYYIENFAENLEPYYEVIANHFILAESQKNIVKWSRLAATKNYDFSAYGISNYYYNQALSNCKDCLQKNELLLSIATVNINLNKNKETEDALKQLNMSLLTQDQRELYYLYKVRLLELQKDFTNFQKTYEEVKKLIKTKETLLRIQLIAFDYYRMNNSLEQFEQLKTELQAEITTQSSTFEIIFYSILGQFYLDRAKYDEAENYYSKLNVIATKHNKKFFLRIATISLGIIETRKGNQKKAISYLRQAMSIAEELGDKHGFAKASTEMAMISFTEGNDEQALSTLKSCLQVATYIGDKQQEQTILYNFGYIYNVLQDYPKSIKYLLEARSIATLINDKVGLAFANDGLGDAYYLTKDYVQAKELYLVNLELQKELGDKEGIAHTIGNLANIYREEKDYPKALEHYDIQLRELQNIGDKVGQGKALFNWGMTHDFLGDSDEAMLKLESAYQLFSEANDKNYADFVKQQIERIKGKKKDSL